MFNYSNSNRSTRAIIHLDNLKWNLDRIRELIGPDKKICLAVKADGYGHGAVAVSKAALEQGVSHLGVSSVDEAKELRDAGITSAIILMGHPREEEISQVVTMGLEPFVGNEEYLQRLDLTVRETGAPPLGIHIKIDTGMGRIGCPAEDAPYLARLADTADGLTLAGICTHFPVSDSPDDCDVNFTKDQIQSISNIRKELLSMNIDPGLVHAANSGGVLLHEQSALDMVRVGISAYGYLPDSRVAALRDVELKPVMELKTEISFIKTVYPGQSVSYGRKWTAGEETDIATVPVGYGDGYFRLLTGKAEVLYKGRRCPVVGTICMDQIMIDLGKDSKGTVGEDITLFGPDRNGPDAEELSALIGTIPYEITCAINKRVPREPRP